MVTVTEDPKPAVQERAAGAGVSKTEFPPALVGQVPQYRPLFSDSLLEKGFGERKRKRVTTTVSFAIQCGLIGVLIVVPMMFIEDLPKSQLLTFLVAPPPPPPPPPPPAAIPQVRVVRETNVLDSGRLRTPTRIPRKVEMIKEEAAPPPMSAGVVGGVPGGVPGGQLGGVIGGLISSIPAANIPKLEPPKRIRVSQGVTQGLLLHKVEPVYPKIALAARVMGVVLVKAVIGKDGIIKELEIVNGSPLLTQAAIEALKQWRYRPYLLNGEPVEVETNITVTFQISS
jgi:periplasmic protein TonB